MNSNEFDDLRPYYDDEVQPKLREFVKDPMFGKLAGYIWPGITEEEIRSRVEKVRTAFDFQVQFMHGAIREIVRRSSSGLSYSGFEHIEPGKPYLFISNHRDIMLDSAILQVLLVETGHQTSEITFGNNLMSPGFITEFGKLNRMFTVQREGNSKELYNISRHLSHYIRHTITEKKVSVWIAQRNGRTKDGHDITQTGLLKMLNISSQRSLPEGFRELNIIPMAISYEYEPCDFFKARELYLSSMHTVYRKDADEDLKSIVAGLTGFKGHIHLSLGPVLDKELDLLSGIDNENEKFKFLAATLDKHIYREYRLFKTHFMAWDLLNHSERFSNHYTPQERAGFEEYISNGLSQMELNNPDVRNLVLKIYATPVENEGR